MTNPRVICTGCELALPEEGKALHGDLWQQGDTLIFNGVLKGFDTAWLYGAEMQALLEHGDRKIVFLTTSNYFDRRGIIVFKRADCTLSRAMKVHLDHWYPDYKGSN